MSKSLTKLTSSCVWGDSGFNNTSELKVGKSGSGTYYGRVTFATLGIPNAVILSVLYKMNRNDSYSAKTLQLGSSQDPDWADKGTQDWKKDFTVSGGTGTKTFDLTAYKDIFRKYAGTWYMHVQHGSGDNSYCEFNGDESSDSTTPRLIVTYEDATVEYFKDGAWQKCLVHYRDSTGNWVQCIPYTYQNGLWVQV